MKNIFKAFFVIAAAALTLVGCQKKEIELPQDENVGEYMYTFAIDDETRAVIGDSNIEWVDGDQVGIFINPVGDFTGFKGYSSSSSHQEELPSWSCLTSNSEAKKFSSVLITRSSASGAE